MLMKFQLRSINILSMCCSVTARFGSYSKQGIILQSLSNNVYDNLAVEDWIHDHMNLEEKNVLFLWKNLPSVVIGRHQNPWKECNLHLMRNEGIVLARRRSGGGTVYHDLGNINLTFFTLRQKYDRMENLNLVIRALKALQPHLDVKSTPRYDILLDGKYKISGTAAKLGRKVAYHHCTLLCSANSSLLPCVLQSPYRVHDIQSNATPSVPSLVRNLSQADSSLTCEAIIDSVVSEYSALYDNKPSVHLIDPKDETVFSGLCPKQRDLSTWEWIYGKTPRFIVATSFQIGYKQSLLDVNLTMDIKNGYIETCSMKLPNCWLPAELCDELQNGLVGSKFCPKETAFLMRTLLRTCSQNEEVHSKWNMLCDKLVSIM
ncbi:lipoyl amidotransferase LIPT1, mitochondrial [Pelodytes ibericus]